MGGTTVCLRQVVDPDSKRVLHIVTALRCGRSGCSWPFPSTDFARSGGIWSDYLARQYCAVSMGPGAHMESTFTV